MSSALSSVDEYTQKQADRQAQDAHTPHRLNFQPFEPDLTSYPLDKDFLKHHTILSLQQAMEQGSLSAYQLSLHCLKMIQSENPHLNAVLEINPDTLTIARQRDTERREGHVRSPLHGLPILLKGNIGTQDQLSTTAGAQVLQGAHALEDAFLVQNLREAGAIIIGKANLSEWANWYTTTSINGFSVLGGQTHNPHGAFDVGGSSSGSAVALAAHLVPLSIGSETTGSLVYPASQNGVMTLKPSLGLISRSGIIPITEAFDTAGPMAHTITDLALLMNTLAASADPTDPRSAAAASLIGSDFTRFLHNDALKGLKVGLIQRDTTSLHWRQEDADFIAKIEDLLLQASAIVKPCQDLLTYLAPDTLNDFLQQGFDVLRIGFRVDLEHYLQTQGAHVPVHSLEEIINFNAANPEKCVPYGQDLLEQSASTTTEEMATYEALKQSVIQAHQNLYHTVKEHLKVDFFIDLSNYAAIIHSRAAYPAVTLPIGHRSSGEPLGMTLFADYLSDAHLLGYAYALEQIQN